MDRPVLGWVGISHEKKRITDPERGTSKSSILLLCITTVIIQVTVTVYLVIRLVCKKYFEIIKLIKNLLTVLFIKKIYCSVFEIEWDYHKTTCVNV